MVDEFQYFDKQRGKAWALVVLYINVTFSSQVLGDKGEIKCPDFESDRVSFKNQKESKKLQKIFRVKDRLHFCGSCEDDFKGKTWGCHL